MAGRKLSPIYLDEDQDEGLPSKITVVRRVSRKRLAFGWYGGKFSHLDWLLPLLPVSRQYCEPFGGSAAVLINRDPSLVETYNDIDGDLVNFFRVLRQQPDELQRQIALTPFSREEYAMALTNDDDEMPLERARRFFVRARQTRTGLAQTASLGRWANCRNTSRSNMSGVVSRWLGGVEALGEIAARLARVQIENRPAQDVIDLYDDPNTLFYCDPPYLHETRGDAAAYSYELGSADHAALSVKLHRVVGKVALSGYRCDFMDTEFADWRRFDTPPHYCHSIKKERVESLWMNY